MGFIFSRLLPWLLRWWLRKVQKRFDTGSGAQSPKDHVKPNSASKRKRIDPAEGHYVDFEEIE